MRLFVRRVVRAGIAGCLLVAAVPVPAAERLGGPVAAHVIQVVDGDTLTVEARIWVDVRIVVKARIRGIDAPELRGACDREKEMAAEAKAALSAVAEARLVHLTNIEHDKYAGRILADIATTDGTDLAGHMLAAGLARPYDGGTRGAWCDLAGLGD